MRARRRAAGRRDGRFFERAIGLALVAGLTAACAAATAPVAVPLRVALGRDRRRRDVAGLPPAARRPRGPPEARGHADGPAAPADPGGAGRGAQPLARRLRPGARPRARPARPRGAARPAGVARPPAGGRAAARWLVAR